MLLHDGSRIAVIGAGPAGSMFSYFLLNMAAGVALRLHVDLYEPRQFCHLGPAGCNHCGGVVSESLVQLLATEGMILPDCIVQTGLESYMLHMDVGVVRIDTPLQESRIASVYRGNGPRTSLAIETRSFDDHLRQLAVRRGAHAVRRLVTSVRRNGDAMQVDCADGSHAEYELVAIACGVNSQLLRSLHGLVVDHDLPALRRTFVCEFRLGREVVQDTIGRSMHVFLLDIPKLRFAALIPKGDCVTLCLLGDDIDEQLIDRFFSAPEVRRCFPGALVPRPVCHCYPRINVRTTRPPYDDRLVMIGDSGTTRLFKDGIGAAYRTAKAAAKTAVFHGVSAEDFRVHFWPLCEKIDADNRVGHLLFSVGGQLQHARFARRSVLRMVAAEQGRSGAHRHMSSVLWDLFSGSASYTDIFVRGLQPAFVGRLAWNLIAGICVVPSAVRRGRETVTSIDLATDCLHRTQPIRTHAQQLQTTPPCQAQCPVGGDIRRWLGIIAQREKLGLSLEQAYDRAWEEVAQRNPFPAVLGRICPHPCESHCSRAAKDGAVSICAMERFLGDWGIARQLQLPVIAQPDCTESIGVIGAGPAGLSFAYQMARRGYPVTIYEKRTLPGGLLRHAIPDFRLPREIVEAETRRILALPIELVCGVDVGQGIGLRELQARHRMLFVGIGAPLPRKLGVPGEEGPGVLSGVEYLTQRKLGYRTALGSHVIVVGAGDTAIDTARSARRDGADVTLLYRRGPAEIPAQPSEVRDARIENVRFEYLTAARRIRRSGHRICGVEVQRMRLDDAAEDGRRRPIPIPRATLALAADTILAAVSQEPDWRGIAASGHERDWLHVGNDGRLADDIWAGGDDCGVGIAIGAIAQGRVAAEAAHTQLRNRAPSRQPRSHPLLEPARLKPDCYERAPRALTIRRPATQWLSEPEIEIDRTLTSEQALREAGRCFSCGLCFGCEQCFMYCNSGGFMRIPSTAPGRYFDLSPECCEGCGICIELCPCAYLQPREVPREP